MWSLQADVVFEADKGFWAAIQTFVSTTKRPIIMTTTQSNFLHFFDPKIDLQIETMTLKPASLVSRCSPGSAFHFRFMLNLFCTKFFQSNLATYLQLVCLAENVRTDHAEMTSLAQLYNCDLRRLLLALQCWVETGGSAHPELHDVKTEEPPPQVASVDRAFEHQYLFQIFSLLFVQNIKGFSQAVTEDESAPAIEDDLQKTLTSSQPEASNDDEAGSDDDDNVYVGAKQLLRRRMLTNARAIFEDNSSNDSFASKADDNQATQQVSLGSSDVTTTGAHSGVLLHRGVVEVQLGASLGADSLLRQVSRKS